MLPKSTNALLHLAHQFLRALDCHRHALGLCQTATDLSWKVQRLECQITAFSAAENAKRLSAARVAVSDKALRKWLSKARLVLQLAEGSASFQRCNYPATASFRTGVPRGGEDRLAHGRALVTFFARHPEFGVPFADITAANGRALCDRVIQSGEMLRLASDEYAVVRNQRDKRAAELRRSLREISSVLETQLTGSDQRWADFGLLPRQSRNVRSEHPDADPAPQMIIVATSDQSHEAAAA